MSNELDALERLERAGEPLVFFYGAYLRAKEHNPEVAKLIASFEYLANGSVPLDFGKSYYPALERWCTLTEKQLQDFYKLPVVVGWQHRPSGTLVLHLDLLFEMPNAPFPHNVGVLN